MELASERSITCSRPYCARLICHGLNRWCWVSASRKCRLQRLRRSIWTTLYKLLCTERIFNLWFHHSSCNGNCLAYETCLRRWFIFHISPTVQLNLYNIIDSKWKPPASKQNSHLLKIFFDKWRGPCLEVLPFSLRILHFSCCKVCQLSYIISSTVSSLKNDARINLP